MITDTIKEVFYICKKKKKTDRRKTIKKGQEWNVKDRCSNRTHWKIVGIGEEILRYLEVKQDWGTCDGIKILLLVQPHK